MANQHSDEVIHIQATLEGIDNLFTRYRFHLVIKGIEIIKRQIVETDHRQVFDNILVAVDT